jgi:hypothetical protein
LIGEDILNNMSVIEEGEGGGSVFEGSVLIEEVGVGSRGGRASSIIAHSVDGGGGEGGINKKNAFSILREDGSSVLLDELSGSSSGLRFHDNASSDVAIRIDQFSDMEGKIEAVLGGGSFGEEEERGMTAEAPLFPRPDTAALDGWEESLADELVNFNRFDDLLGEGEEEGEEGSPAGMGPAAAAAAAKTAPVGHRALQKPAAAPPPQRQKQERAPDGAGAVDMKGFPFFLAPGSANSNAGEGGAAEHSHHHHHHHSQHNTQQADAEPCPSQATHPRAHTHAQKPPHAHQPQPQKPAPPRESFLVKYAKREVGEHEAAPMPWHNDHKHDLHDFHEPGE